QAAPDPAAHAAGRAAGRDRRAHGADPRARGDLARCGRGQRQRVARRPRGRPVGAAGLNPRAGDQRRAGPGPRTLVRGRSPAYGRPRGVTARRFAMRAVVYHGPGRKAWEEVPKPTLVDDTDAIVRVDAVTICGTDLHILKGDVPAVTDGRILGHEAVGTVEEVGSAVKNVAVGDRVLVSCISACGRCRYCRESAYGQCVNGCGWTPGHLIDGTQAEMVRVPFADNSTYPIPDGVSDEQVLMLADILPTGYEVGTINGQVAPGDTVAVVGAGPIGLATIMAAKLLSPSHVIAIDLADSRLEAAERFGADVTINNATQDPVARVRELTGGL